VYRSKTSAKAAHFTGKPSPTWRMPGCAFPIIESLENSNNSLATRHSILYQAGRARSSNWTKFWRETWPRQVRGAARPILLATAVFWACTALGFFLAIENPVLENFFVSREMREAISSKRLWTESLTRTAPTASSGIATNNLRVSILIWGLGLSFGIGTLWLLAYNGLMLGAVAAACLREGMLLPLTEFVVAHGSLELPAIWISGGAGLLMAQAIVFPERYSRSVELRLKGRSSVQIIVGIVPMLLVAGAIEAFISPSKISGVAKALLGLSLALALLGYILTFGQQSSDQASQRVP